MSDADLASTKRSASSLERAKRLDAERVPIERAYGRVLAEPVAARVDLPPFPSSAMDGYALRSADTAAAPVSLALAGVVAAGSPASRPLESGEAMAISTGGVVPDGADAVIPLELARTRGRSGGDHASRSRRARTCAVEAATSPRATVVLERGDQARRGAGGRARRGRHRRSALREASAGRDPRHRLGAA